MTFDELLRQVTDLMNRGIHPKTPVKIDGFEAVDGIRYEQQGGDHVNIVTNRESIPSDD